MQTTNSATIKEVGIDYITATTVARHTATSLDSFGRFVVDEQIAKGERDRAFTFSGYVGRSAGAATYGRRADGGIVRFSGNTAAEYWEHVVSLATNVSRFDLQVTLSPSDGPTQRLRRHFEQVKKKATHRGKPATYKLWVGPGGPESLLLGSRASERYGRIYDKWLESKLAEYQGFLRYELELKGGMALKMAKQLESSKRQRSDVCAEISRFLTNRSIVVPELPGVSSSLVQELDVLSDGEIGKARHTTRLRWLRHSVAPCIKELIDAGMMDQVLVALNMDQLVEISPRTPSTTWSNREWSN